MRFDRKERSRRDESETNRGHPIPTGLLYLFLHYLSKNIVTKNGQLSHYRHCSVNTYICSKTVLLPVSCDGRSSISISWEVIGSYLLSEACGVVSHYTREHIIELLGLRVTVGQTVACRPVLMTFSHLMSQPHNRLPKSSSVSDGNCELQTQPDIRFCLH